MSKNLTKTEYERYQRQLGLPGFGVAAQLRLREAKVMVIGCGGLGCPALLYLAAAGVGQLGIVDADVVSLSNLQRQVLFSTAEVGQAKVSAAKQRLIALNPEVEVITYQQQLTANNALDLLAEYDVIIDATDNFATKYLLNDACVLLKKPLVYGAVLRFGGQVSAFAPGQPCYRCLYPDMPSADAAPNCATAGVLGVLPGMIGSLQASEALKIISGIGQVAYGKLLLIDSLNLKFKELTISWDRRCAACGTSSTMTTLTDQQPTQEATTMQTMSVQELKAKLDSGEAVQIIDVREQHEYDFVNIGGELMPLSGFAENIATWQTKIARDKPVVVHCRTGGRSSQAIRLLQQQYGFENLYNLEGGITAWSDEIDPNLPKY